MATLEDAAEALVVKLRGLDSEIEESEKQLDDLKERMESAMRDVAQEWETLREAASSFLDTLRDEQETLADRAEETGRAVIDAQEAVTREGDVARQEIVEGQGQLTGLGQHAAALAPGVDSVAAGAGEAPARSLAERARELEQELEGLVREARDFLQDEVPSAVGDAADNVTQVCQTLQAMLADATTQAFQETYDEWESGVDEMEDHVVTKGYEASHRHARDVVEYAVEECDQACGRHLDVVQQMVGALQGELQQMATEVARSADELVAQTGAELVRELERTRQAAGAAVAALDGVRGVLASYSFVEA